MGAQGSRLLKGLRPMQTRESCCKTLPADLAPHASSEPWLAFPKAPAAEMRRTFVAVKSHMKQGFAHNKPEHEQLVETFQFVERKGDASGGPTASAPGAAGALGPPAPGAAAVGTPAAPEEDDVPF